MIAPRPGARYEVAAADQRRHDLRRVAQRLLERAPRAHGAVPDRDADMGLLLATDPGEELIDVVDDP